MRSSSSGDRRKLNLEVGLELTEAQETVDSCEKRFIHLRAGRRFGKTVLLLSKLIRSAARHPRSAIWYIAPSYRQAEMIAWRGLLTILPPAAIFKKNEAKLEVELVNHSIIALKGADNEDSLRGAGSFRPLMFVGLDEAAFIKPHVWEVIIRPMLVDSGGGAMFISTPRGRNWFYQLEQSARRDPDWGAFHFTIYDNPTIPRDELEKVKLSVSPLVWTQEFLAEYDAATGLVYPEFDERVHVVSRASIDVLPSWWRIRGFDWGLRNPACCLWAGVDPVTRNVYFFDEHYKAGLTVTQHAAIINAKVGEEYKEVNLSIIDPSANKREVGAADTGMEITSVVREFARNGIRFLPANNRKEHGIEIVHRFLQGPDGKPAVFFSDTLTNLIQEMRTYEYQGDPAGEGKEDPVKAHDHAMDAMRYILAEVYRRNLSRVRASDYVMDASVAPAFDEQTMNRLRRRDVEDEYEAPSYL